MHTTGIYEIRNLINGKLYVGSAVDFHARWLKHRSELSRGRHHSQILQRAWEKYGPSAFEFRKVLVCSRENLLMYEQAVIDALAPDYNVCMKASSCLGIKRSSKSIEKFVATRRACDGWKVSPETRAKISESLTGRPGAPRSLEMRAAASIAQKGKFTEHLRSLAKKKIGVPRPADVRVRISKAIASLTDEQVREIRRRCADGERQVDVGMDFGIKQPSVSEIVRRISYTWVTS